MVDSFGTEFKLGGYIRLMHRPSDLFQILTVEPDSVGYHYYNKGTNYVAIMYQDEARLKFEYVSPEVAMLIKLENLA